MVLEKTHLCKICGKKAFARLTDLGRHEMTHTGEKRYKCAWPKCPRSFVQASGLKTHMNTHTREKPHLCGYDGCKRTFGDPSSRARHVLEIHRRLGPYKCPVDDCPTEIKRRSCINKHIRVKHGRDPKEFDLKLVAPPLLPDQRRPKGAKAKTTRAKKRTKAVDLTIDLSAIDVSQHIVNTIQVVRTPDLHADVRVHTINPSALPGHHDADHYVSSAPKWIPYVEQPAYVTEPHAPLYTTHSPIYYPEDEYARPATPPSKYANPGLTTSLASPTDSYYGSVLATPETSPTRQTIRLPEMKGMMDPIGFAYPDSPTAGYPRQHSHYDPYIPANQGLLYDFHGFFFNQQGDIVNISH